MLFFFENDIENDEIFSKYAAYMKEQSFKVCREKINPRYIEKVFRNFHFGWLRVSEKAQVGKRKRSSRSEQQVYSFILCRYGDNLIYIDLICGRENTRGDGKTLINVVETFAEEAKMEYNMDVAAVQIYGAINDLTSYYMNLGYNKGPMIMGKDDDSYIMTKKIVQQNERENMSAI